MSSTISHTTHVFPEMGTNLPVLTPIRESSFHGTLPVISTPMSDIPERVPENQTARIGDVSLL